MNDQGILVMAKAPHPGLVKTRLCPPCTPVEAAEIAEASLCDTLEAATATGRPVLLALEGAPGPWLPHGIDVVPQVQGSFNERLSAAWTNLARGGVQIGMDTPQVTAELLELALEATRATGSAIGPATDGGWWLLGLERPDSRVFVGVEMSTHTTGREQLRRLHELGYEPVPLPALTDIDSWPDACAVAGSLPRSRTCAAVTRVAAARDTVVGAR